MRTFGQLKYDIALRVHDVSSGRMEVIGKYINAAYADIWNAHLWKDSLVFDVPVCVGSARTNTLTLPLFIEQVLLLTRQKTGDLLVPASTYVLQSRAIDQLGKNVGAFAYTRGGTTGVRFDLTAPCRVKVVSSNAQDRQSVVLRGVDEYGFEFTQTLSVDGGSSALSEHSFAGIDFWAKQDVSAGVFSLEDENGNMLDRLSSENLSNRYILIKCDSVVDSDLFVTGKKRFRPLMHDAESPVLPVGGSLFSLALAETLRHTGKYSQASTEESRGWAALDRVLSAQDIMAENSEQTIPTVVCSAEDEGL